MRRCGLLRKAANDRVDVVVVGGGMMGCAIASRMARENMSTVVLESGKDVRKKGKWATQMAARKFIHRYKKSGFETNYATTPQRVSIDDAEAEKQSVPIPTAHVLGGANVVGGSGWIIGDGSDWEGVCNYDEHIRPRIKALEMFETPATVPAHRGKIGKWATSRSLIHSPFYKPFSSMLMEQLHLPLKPTLNSDKPNIEEGIARAEVNMNSMTQVSPSTLDNINETITLRRPLNIRCDTEVAEVNFRGGVAEGVTTANGETIDAGMVILAAGALGTPRVLLNSPRLNKDTAANVGKNLWDVPRVVMQFAVRENLSHHVFTDSGIQLLSYLDWKRSAVSAASSSYEDMVGFYKSNGFKNPTDVRFTCQPFLMDNQGKEGGRHGMQIVVQLARPKSRGTFSMEGVDPNYLSHEEDLHALKKGVEAVREGVQKYMKETIGNDQKPIAEIFESASLTGGTCSVGTVVETPSFNLKGYSNCYVCDSSLLPRPLIGDHQPSLSTFAEHVADQLTNSSGRSVSGVKVGKIA